MISDEQRFYRDVGRKVRAARNRVGMTQLDLADEIDLSRTSVTNIESGNQPVSLWMLFVLGNALNCDPRQLLPGKEEENGTELPLDVPASTAAFIRRLSSQR